MNERVATPFRTVLAPPRRSGRHHSEEMMFRSTGLEDVALTTLYLFV